MSNSKSHCDYHIVLMQISATKVIESLINLVYTLNLITIKVHQSWGSLQDQGVPPSLFQERGLQLPEGSLPGALGLPLGPGQAQGAVCAAGGVHALEPSCWASSFSSAVS